MSRAIKYKILIFYWYMSRVVVIDKYKSLNENFISDRDKIFTEGGCKQGWGILFHNNLIFFFVSGYFLILLLELLFYIIHFL